MTLWPVLANAVALGIVALYFVLPDQLPSPLFLLVPVLLGAILWTFVLIVIYIRLVLQNEDLPSNERTMWILLVLLFSPLAPLLYWYLRVFTAEPVTPRPYSQSQKLLLLVVTLLPGLVLSLNVIAQRQDRIWSFATGIIPLFVLSVLTVVYLLLVMRNGSLSSSERGVWTMVVLLGSLPGMLVYWYLGIWRQQPPSSGPASSSARAAEEGQSLLRPEQKR